MFAKAILILWLFSAPVAPLRPTPHTVMRVAPSRPFSQHVDPATTRPTMASARQAQKVVAKASATRATRASRRHVYRAAARAVEHRLLLVAPRTRLLVRFVDRSTGLVRRNVTAHCELMPRRHRGRPSVYLCRVWQQPRQPSTGTKVLCRTKHKRFVVMAYRRP